jgi:hypothetical protein
VVECIGVWKSPYHAAISGDYLFDLGSYRQLREMAVIGSRTFYVMREASE